MLYSKPFLCLLDSPQFLGLFIYWPFIAMDICMETVSCCSLPTPSHHPRVGILPFPWQRVEMPQRTRAAFRWGAGQMELVRNKEGREGKHPFLCGRFGPELRRKTRERWRETLNLGVHC